MRPPQKNGNRKANAPTTRPFVAVLAVAVGLLMLGHAHAFCQLPDHMVDGSCEQVEWVKGGDLMLQAVASAPNRKTFKGIQLTTAENYPLKQMEQLVVNFGDILGQSIRAQVLELTIGPNEAGETPFWVMIQNNGQYVDEFITTSSTITKTYTSISDNDSYRGIWTIYVTNWDSTTPVFVRHERFEATLRCVDESVNFERDGTISACYTPIPCNEGSTNWDENTGLCASPVIPDDYVLQVDAVDTSSKLVTLTGKAGQSKTLAPKQALRLEFPKHRANKIAVELNDPDRATRLFSVYVHAYYYISSFSRFHLAYGQEWPFGQKNSAEMRLTDSSEDGIWKVLIVNWGTTDVEIPFAWLNVELSCPTESGVGVDFTTQQNGIRACFNLPCMWQEIKWIDGATTECLSVPIKPSKIIPFELKEEYSNDMAKVFESPAGIVTLAPKESAGFILSGFYAMQMILENQNPEDINPDVDIGVRLGDTAYSMVMGRVQGKGQGRREYFADSNSAQKSWAIVVTNVGTALQTFNFATMRVKLTCIATTFHSYSFDGAPTCFPRCPVGQEYSTNDNMCVGLQIPSQNKFALAPTSESTSTVKKFAKAVLTDFPQNTFVEYDFGAFRSESFNLWLPSSAVYPDCDMFIIENDELIEYWEIENFLGPRSRWFNYTTANTGTTGNNKGKWRVLIVNGRSQPTAWNPAGFAIELNCGGDAFATINGITSCLYVPCENPAHHRGNDGVCVAPDLTTNAPAPLAMKDSGSQPTEIKIVGSAATPVTLEPAVAQVIDLSSTRSDKLKVKVGKPATPSKNVVVQVYENNVFVDEFTPAGETKEYTAMKPKTASTVLQTFGMRPGSATMQQQQQQQRNGNVLVDEAIEPWGVGQWKIAVVNWGAAPETFEPSSLSVSLYCADGTSFTGTDVKTCLPYPTTAPPAPTPPPALTCAYTEPVGLNPWEQWNAFALASNIFLMGSTIEGRIAAAEGGVSLANGAQVHTQKEAFISKQADRAVGGPWSISSAGAVIATGTSNAVVSGGVESSSTIFGVSSPTAPEKIPLSVDVAAAAEYFRGRSTEWAGLAQSWIAVNVTASEIRVQLHGKVNVVNGVKLEDLKKFERITLLGHPTGAVIVNVVGVGQAVFSPDLKVVFEGREGVAAAPTFGRVLVNLPDATSVEFASTPATAGPRVVHLSFLAPKAGAIFMNNAPLVKGNVVANSLAVYGVGTGTSLAVQPFGTSARQLARGTPVPPAPKQVWKSEGRQRTACLWHVL